MKRRSPFARPLVPSQPGIEALFAVAGWDEAFFRRLRKALAQRATVTSQPNPTTR